MAFLFFIWIEKLYYAIDGLFFFFIFLLYSFIFSCYQRYESKTKDYFIFRNLDIKDSVRSL
jgi:hypothetical protein